MSYVRRFGRFWYDFIVGEDWRIAAGVAIALAVGGGFAAADVMSGSLLVVLVAAAIAVVVVASVIGTGVSARRDG